MIEIKQATTFMYNNLDSPNIEFWANGYVIYKDRNEDKYVAIYYVDDHCDHSQILNTVEECNLWLINN
jgi:hypothetical protein